MISIRLTSLISLLFLLALSCGSDSAPAVVPTRDYSKVIVITNARILDGLGGVIPNGTVEITGNRITFAGPASGYQPPTGAETLDADGHVVLPGIINAHVHRTNSNSSSSFSGQDIRREFLLGGVTGTCNTGHPVRGMESFETSFTKDGSPAGRAFNSGPHIAAHGGYPSVDGGPTDIYAVNGEEEARAAVADLVEQGADYVKISVESGFFSDTPTGQPLLSPGEIAAIVDEASRLGVRVRAHVSDGELLRLALDAGVNSIEHTPAFRDVSVEQVADLDSIFDLQSPGVSRIKGLLAEMVGQDVVIVPTLTLMDAEKPWTRIANGETVSLYEEVVEYFHSIGGTVALGTDYPFDPQEGMPMNEIEALGRAGLSNMEVITAATYNSALVCGQADELGSIEEGKLADLIIVNGDPSLDLNALRDLRAVILDGQVVVGG